MSRDIGIVECDDWIAVYLNYGLVYEGHSITPDMLLEKLEIPFDRIYIDDEQEAEEYFLKGTPETYGEAIARKDGDE